MVDLSVIRLSGVWLNRRNFAPKSKSIFEMNIKSIITAAIALLISTACSGSAKQEKVMAKDGKALVVFFSHAGDSYAVGNIEVGNTKIVADYITELTGAEQFEIVTHKYDGMAYNPLIKLAQEEARNSELPEYEGDIDLNKYVTKSFSIYGHEVRTEKKKVEKWLNSLGY